MDYEDEEENEIGEGMRKWGEGEKGQKERSGGMECGLRSEKRIKRIK